MCLLPLSGEYVASLPQVLESSGLPPVPNPILELQVEQSFCWLLMIPILGLYGNNSPAIALISGMKTLLRLAHRCRVNPDLLRLFFIPQQLKRS